MRNATDGSINPYRGNAMARTSFARTPGSTKAATRGVEVVYYVAMDDGTVKIGTTGNFTERIRAHGLPGMRNRDRVLVVEFGGRALESERHLQFAHLRQGKTERFAMESDLMSHIESLRQSLGLVP